MSDEHSARTTSLEARLTSVKMDIDDDDEEKGGNVREQENCLHYLLNRISIPTSKTRHGFHSLVYLRMK